METQELEQRLERLPKWVGLEFRRLQNEIQRLRELTDELPNPPGNFGYTGERYNHSIRCPLIEHSAHWDMDEDDDSIEVRGETIRPSGKRVLTISYSGISTKQLVVVPNANNALQLMLVARPERQS